MKEYAVDLIERYLAQVGRRLPANVREDVLAELRSSLEDGLEARTASGEDPQQAVIAALQELGPPDLLAASFIQRPRFLVGPELYPTFVRVVGITVTAVSALLVFAALAGSLRDPSSDLVSAFGRLTGNLVQSAIAVFGWIAIVFWAVERLGRRRADDRQIWDPSALPPVNDPDLVSRAGLAVGLFFLSAFLLVLNVFPDKIVALVSFDGTTAVMPLVGPGLRAVTPLITVVLGGMLALRLVVLARGRWSRTLRWFDLGLDLLWIGVLIRLLRTPDILAADIEVARAAGWTAEQITTYTGTVVPVLQTLLAVGMTAGLVGCAVGLIVGLVRQFRRSTGSPGSRRSNRDFPRNGGHVPGQRHPRVHADRGRGARRLLDALQPPIVLREGRNVRLPNTGPGNRFVSGWRFEETSAGPTIEPDAGGARVEVVQMHPRPRTLALSTRGDVSGLVVSAAIGSRQVDVQTSGSNIEILLPADLAQGRHLVDLEFADPSGVEISGGSLSAAERSGRVDFEGDDVVHEGWSAIDFVRWVEPGTRLVGEFVPPPNASPEQRFALLLDRGDGTLETVVEIRPSSRSPGEPVSLLDPLRETSGLVRIRLVAEGEGGAGRWRGLRLRSREPKKVTAIERVPEPPRLVVVYVLDALRSDAVGHLGSDLGATPCIDRLAAEGAVFANHFSVAPNTGPATTHCSPVTDSCAAGPSPRPSL